jgi:uncharacterized protein YndB with AHSA1/START domain
MMPTRDSVSRFVVLPVPPDDAWEALTRPSELSAWLADEVESDGPLEEGSEAILRWDDGQERVAVVDEADEPRRLAFTWRAARTDDETRVEFTLVELPQGTLLTVVESGFARVPSLSALRSDWAPRLVAHAGALLRA